MVAPRLVEFASVFVLALYAFFARPRLRDVLVIAAGAFLGEEICIRLYGAYQYSPAWSLFVDRVPVAVLCIWPAVVLSARAVAARLAPGRDPSGAALATGAIVLLDAALIEPVATQAGLWSWNLPGAFSVPPVAPFGWACYAFAAALVLARLERAKRSATLSLGAPFAVAALAHALILAGWWSALRWLQVAIPERAAVAAAVFSGAGLFILALRLPRLSWRDSAPRACASAVFAGLLVARPEPHLVAYAACLAVPWLAVLDWRR